MLSNEEKKAIEYLKIEYEKLMKEDNILFPLYKSDAKRLIDIIEKQSKEIEELKETLKCTQNSWYEDTQKIEEMKKQIDLDNECEIALNNRIMDLENADKKWKDKIKARIEELQNDIQYSANPLSIDNSKFGIKVLQSLLEKE